MASITLSFHSEALERTVPLRALVPLEDAPHVPMPALYLLHGLYGSEQDWFPAPQPPQCPPRRMGHSPQFSPQRDSRWSLRTKPFMAAPPLRFATRTGP